MAVHRSVAKVSLSSSNYMDTLLKDIPMESIPALLGGGFTSYNESYSFDLSPGGPLHYEGAPTQAPAIVNIEDVVLEKGERRSGGDSNSVDTATSTETMNTN